MNVLPLSERPLGVCIFLGGGSIRFHIPKEVCDPKDVKSQGKPLTPPSDDDRRAFPALSGSFSRKPFLNYSYHSVQIFRPLCKRCPSGRMWGGGRAKQQPES